MSETDDIMSTEQGAAAAAAEVAREHPEHSALRRAVAAVTTPESWTALNPVPCWKGVTLDAAGNVTHIVAAGMMMNGQLDCSALSELRHLQYLNIGNNYISGEFDLACLSPHMAHLCLGNNNSCVIKNWSCLANLRSLRVLNLSATDLSSAGTIDFALLPRGLVTLYLCLCEFAEETSVDVSALPRGITNMRLHGATNLAFYCCDIMQLAPPSLEEDCLAHFATLNVTLGTSSASPTVPAKQVLELLESPAGAALQRQALSYQQQITALREQQQRSNALHNAMFADYPAALAFEQKKQEQWLELLQRQHAGRRVLLDEEARERMELECVVGMASRIAAEECDERCGLARRELEMRQRVALEDEERLHRARLVEEGLSTAPERQLINSVPAGSTAGAEQQKEVRQIVTVRVASETARRDMQTMAEQAERAISAANDARIAAEQRAAAAIALASEKEQKMNERVAELERILHAMKHPSSSHTPPETIPDSQSQLARQMQQEFDLPSSANSLDFRADH